MFGYKFIQIVCSFVDEFLNSVSFRLTCEVGGSNFVIRCNAMIARFYVSFICIAKFS